MVCAIKLQQVILQLSTLQCLCSCHSYVMIVIKSISKFPTFATKDYSWLTEADRKKHASFLLNHRGSHTNTLAYYVIISQRQDQSKQPLFFLILFFSTFEHVKSLLIMGPNDIKNSSLECDFHIIILSESCFNCKRHQI